MKTIILILSMAIFASSAHSQTCDKRQSEIQVRDVIKKIMDLRARQDDGFLAFYATDEYSFPGESWEFHGEGRSAQRKPETQSARDLGMTWRMEIQDLHSHADCDLAWIAGIVIAQQMDPHNTVVSEAKWRLTAILEKRPSGWLIVHQHSSLPTPDPKLWWKSVSQP